LTGSATAAPRRLRPGGGPGGGVVGTGGGPDAVALGVPAAFFLRPRLAGVGGCSGADGAGAAFLAAFFLAARVTMRLFAPRTGARGAKIHPMPGTGLPPTSRPSSNSHG
jgi:hypothetical protein